jgi:hypothetical protein
VSLASVPISRSLPDPPIRVLTVGGIDRSYSESEDEVIARTAILGVAPSAAVELVVSLPAEKYVPTAPPADEVVPAETIDTV